MASSAMTSGRCFLPSMRSGVAPKLARESFLGWRGAGNGRRRRQKREKDVDRIEKKMTEEMSSFVENGI